MEYLLIRDESMCSVQSNSKKIFSAWRPAPLTPIARGDLNGYRFGPKHLNRKESMALFVYMTAGSAEEAQRIADDLVENRLAACVNIFPPIRSIYTWKGEICRSEEIAFVAKTEDDRFEALAERVRRLHSYETPCIVALPIARGDADFLAWIAASTHTEE